MTNKGSRDKYADERRFFPIMEECIFLDHCTGGIYPTYSRDAMIDYIKRGSETGMTFEQFAEYWVYTDSVRNEVAHLFHCTGNDICFGSSSTQLFNIFINGLDLQPGDNVITSSASHESVPFILLNQRQNGVEVRFVDPIEGVTDPDQIFSLVDSRTRAICLNHVEKFNGFRHDLKIYGDFCRSHGIALGIDASNSAGVMYIDVNEMNVDFVTCSGYKWLMSPLGIGAAYISPALQKSLKLVDTGWCSEKERWNKNVYEPNTRTNACRFECGGLSIIGLIGLESAVKHYANLGSSDVQEYVLSLSDYLYQRVNLYLKEITVYGDIPSSNRSNIVFLSTPENYGLNEKFMESKGIRAHCFNKGTLLRIGLHYINNKRDIDSLIAFLSSVEQNNI